MQLPLGDEPGAPPADAPQPVGRRRSTTGAAQEQRIAWGKTWGKVTSEASNRVKEQK